MYYNIHDYGVQDITGLLIITVIKARNSPLLKKQSSYTLMCRPMCDFPSQ